MARTLYGLTGGDVVAQVSIDDGDFEPASAAMTVWDAYEDGAQLTDLTTYGGSPVSDVTPDALGRATFYGPDGFTADLYLEDADGGRWLVRPSDLTSRANGAGVPAGGTAGQTVVKQSGTDYDAEWETLTADSFVDGVTNHVFTAADDTKLAGIATGATANLPDTKQLLVATYSGGTAVRPIAGSTYTVLWVCDDAADAAALALVSSGTAGRYANDIITTRG